MAKDGTMRGGPRFGQGRPPKAIQEKIAAGNPGGRKLQIMEVPDATDLSENVEELTGEEEWLKGRGCEKLVNPQLVSQYAMTVARWIQCEEAISEYGFIAKHPTTNAAIASPYVSMSQNYMKQVNQLWYQIYQIVKENCLTDYGGQTPQDDAMERLLRARKGMN